MEVYRYLQINVPLQCQTMRITCYAAQQHRAQMFKWISRLRCECVHVSIFYRETSVKLKITNYVGNHHQIGK